MSTVTRLENLVVYLENELALAQKLLAQAKGQAAKDAALMRVGTLLEASGREWATTDEVRQFGLVVAYAVIEAALSEEPFLPAVFTADDLVIASDVLAGEMSRGWGDD